MALTRQQQELIEKIGVFYEREGRQPVCGRILGLLLVSDRPELTFDEVRELLQISKSATSNALNLLLQTGTVEYITYSGDRKRYFRLKKSSLLEGFTEKFNKIIGIKEILKEVLASRSNKTQDFNCGLQEYIDFMEFMEQEIPLLLEKWKVKRS